MPVATSHRRSQTLLDSECPTAKPALCCFVTQTCTVLLCHPDLPNLDAEYQEFGIWVLPLVVLLSVKGLCMSPMPLWDPTVWAFSPPCLCYCLGRMMKHALELYLPIDQLLLCQTDVPSPVVDAWLADRLMAGEHSNAQQC